MLTHTATKDSVVVVLNGKTHTVRRGMSNFEPLVEALKTGNEEAVGKCLTPEGAVEFWAKGLFKLRDGKLYYGDDMVPEAIYGRIKTMASRGEDPTPLFKFWERLQRNPSMRSVRQLYGFMQHGGIPITDDGTILTYKGVTDGYRDCHTGTVDNRPGAMPEMPRNKISDDPDVACHEGYHVGALAYASTFGPVTVICEVDPEHVVCVPKDSSQQKMRVCKYRVIGNYSGERRTMPDTIVKLADLGLSPMDEMAARNEVEAPPGSVAKELEELRQAKEALARQNEALQRQCAATAQTATGGRRPAMEAPKKAAPEVKVRRAPKDPFDKMHSMSGQQLLALPSETLRNYAGKGLDIVGASKILGGKTALVRVILKTRAKLERARAKNGARK